MRPPLWQRLDAVARNLTPFGLTLILVILSVVPLHLPDFQRVAPGLTLMAVYHWAIYRPNLLPASVVFLIGVLQDALMGLPMGVSAVVFLTVYGVVLSQRRFFAGKSFAIVWFGFTLVAAGAAVESCLLVSAFNTAFLNPEAALYQYVVTVGVFPILAWGFLRWQRTFLRLE